MDDLISLGETLQQASSALVGDDIQADPRSGSAPVIQLLVIGAPGSGKSAVLNTLIGHAVLDNVSNNDAVILDNVSNNDAVILDNVSNNDAVILVVISATAVKDSLKILRIAHDIDREVKDSLKIIRIAHDIDREGVRTIGVITKFDQVMKDRDTAKLAVDLLQKQGAAMAQDYPWVAVIGQPLGDKDTNEPMDGAWQEEYKVLSQFAKYPLVAVIGKPLGDKDTNELIEAAWHEEGSSQGAVTDGLVMNDNLSGINERVVTVMRANGVKGMDTPMGRDALLRLIARTVRHKMKEKIPRIMSALEGRSQEVDAELLRLGDSLVSSVHGSRALALELCRELGESLVSSLNGSRALALELCRGFETKFCEHLDGSEVRVCWGRE
ncbi:unnamed protein product [Closterium sp. NIES-54]